MVSSAEGMPAEIELALCMPICIQERRKIGSRNFETLLLPCEGMEENFGNRDCVSERGHGALSFFNPRWQKLHLSSNRSTTGASTAGLEYKMMIELLIHL